MKIKVFIGMGLSIVAILLFTVFYDTPNKKMEARKAICERFNNEGKPEIGEIFYGAESGLGLSGNYTVRELYKLADILEDKLVEEGELPRSIYRKWKKGTDCQTLFFAHGVGHPGALLGHRSEAMMRVLEARLDRKDVEQWMIGTWSGEGEILDWNGNDVRVACELTIKGDGYTTQSMRMAGRPADIEHFILQYDRRSKQLFYKDGNVNVTFPVDPQYHIIKMGYIDLYKE